MYRMGDRPGCSREIGNAMTDEERPVVTWGSVRKTVKLWQVIAGVFAILVPAIGYVVRVESFIADHAKKFGAVEDSAVTETDTNLTVHKIAKRLGVGP